MSSTLLNITAVAVSFFALIFSLLFALQQIRVMRQANQMPIFIDMIKEFRSKEFQQAEQYILHRLRYESPADSGVLRLKDEARLAATVIQSFFGVLADLVMRGIISEEAAVSTLGFRASNLWTELQPFIVAERRIRGDDDFACYYEDFVCRARLNWPPEKYYRRVLQRIDGIGVETTNDKAGPVLPKQEEWIKMSAQQRADYVKETICSPEGMSPGSVQDETLRRLGIRVKLGDVRKIGMLKEASRYLGPLTGACAGVVDNRAPSAGAMLLSLVRGKIPRSGIIFIAFMNGRRYERNLRWPSPARRRGVDEAVSRFNEMADRVNRV